MNYREESPFLEAIIANPEDLPRRQVYADWLEEQGDPRAEYLRFDANFERISFIDWVGDSIDHYIEVSPELQQPVEEWRAEQAVREKVRSFESQLDPDWLALMNTFGCRSRPFSFFNNTSHAPIDPEKLPFRDSLCTRGAVVTFASAWNGASLTPGFIHDLRLLGELGLGECSYGAASCPIHPFICPIETQRRPLRGSDVVEALRIKGFFSRYIETLDAPEIPYPGYNAGGENDEIHNDFGGQYIFAKEEDEDEIDEAVEPGEFDPDTGTHGRLRNSVVDKRLWYVLQHIDREHHEDYSYSEFVALFAVGLSLHGDRLIGVITHQMCHNLCD